MTVTIVKTVASATEVVKDMVRGDLGTVVRSKKERRKSESCGRQRNMRKVWDLNCATLWR